MDWVPAAQLVSSQLQSGMFGSFVYFCFVHLSDREIDRHTQSSYRPVHLRPRSISAGSWSAESQLKINVIMQLLRCTVAPQSPGQVPVLQVLTWSILSYSLP